MVTCDVAVVGAGIVGLAIASAVKEARPSLKVVVFDKEIDIAYHASGRNSGVLHAGFYYSPDSLKAKFCRVGNAELKGLCRRHGIPVVEVGKVVVAKNSEESQRLEDLYLRGAANGVDLELRPEAELSRIEPLARTVDRFLWSPSTAVSAPIDVADALRQEFLDLGGELKLGEQVQFRRIQGETRISGVATKHIVNAAGAHSDRLARQVGVGLDYAMLPFMGLYRSVKANVLPLRRLVYPVPHPLNPFLGVHFTITAKGLVKIGPTALPVLGREQYSLREGWSPSDIRQALIASWALARGVQHDLSQILATEWPRVMKRRILQEAAQIVPSSANVGPWLKQPPGIRAQLVHLPTGRLEQDFVVRQADGATHVLNAVSPGWTSALPFGRWVAEQYVLPAI